MRLVTGVLRLLCLAAEQDDRLEKCAELLVRIFSESSCYGKVIFVVFMGLPLFSPMSDSLHTTFK